jgi:hypothetical protein
MVTFEIAPEDERDFNEIYDTEHIPNILQNNTICASALLFCCQP